jgi:hypothetical protein
LFSQQHLKFINAQITSKRPVCPFIEGDIPKRRLRIQPSFQNPHLKEIENEKGTNGRFLDCLASVLLFY